MTAWVNFGSFSTDKMTPILMKHHNNVDEDGSVWITVSTGGFFQFTIDEADIGNDRCYSTTAVVADVWYHLAAVKSGTSMKLYVNGVEECSITQIRTPNIGGGDINIGSSPGFDHGTYFYEFVENLKIDEVTIWTKALSATEVSDMQIKAVDPASTDLGAYYRFDKPQDSLFIRDYSGNANNATANQYDHRRISSDTSIP